MSHELCPSKEQIKAARVAAGLTQEQAAAVVYRNSLTRWSEWETGMVPMQPAVWELFLFKTGQHPSTPTPSV